MNFEQDYFSDNIPSWKKVLEGFKNKKNISVLEIGCFEGRATLWLLKNILTQKNSNISVIDTFEGSIENKDKKNDTSTLLKRFKSNISLYKEKVKIYKGFGFEVSQVRESGNEAPGAPWCSWYPRSPNARNLGHPAICQNYLWKLR